MEQASVDLVRANLFLNHSRAKHSGSCWRCDEPWPCLTMAAIIDADHDCALWREKWTAAVDTTQNWIERYQQALAENASLKAERDELQRQLDLANSSEAAQEHIRVLDALANAREALNQAQETRRERDRRRRMRAALVSAALRRLSEEGE
jgi:hypothetical protein